ncbi:glycine-rich protein-like [Gastrolobium bilobum]|uniref:glycine-rich protein-like n=1 Tax=Gastrolobium bilobum TaxID=150636 RepID=UPI002AB01A7C|nr:glycine-rich protein-like [Gastrolobium bilobum]
MASKALLVLVIFLASALLISSKVAPKDLNEKFDKNNDDLDVNGIDESKYYRSGGYGGSWRGGYGGGYGGYCRFGCCRWSYYGGCRRCCHYPGEHVEADTDAEPHN